MKQLKNFLIAVCIAPFAAVAQSDDMETDRPGESFSPDIVSKKHVQVEAGFSKERNKNEDEPDDKYLYPSASFRYGLSKKLELRMLLEAEADYENTPDKHKTASGVEPIKVGFKYNFFDEKGVLPKTSVIARADIPTFASPDFKADFVAPFFRLTMQNSLSKKLSVLYNIGEEWKEDDVHGEFFYSFSPQLELTDKLQIFAEVFGYASKQQTAKSSFDAGLLYKVKPNLQFDIFSGHAISKNAPEHFVELGVSFRLPK